MLKTLLLALALLLSGCAIGAPPPVDPLPAAPAAAAPDGAAVAGRVDAVAGRVLVTGTQGLILANLVYQTVGTAALAGMEAGVIAGPLKDQVKALDRRVIAALGSGRRAKDAAAQARAAATALAALGEISRLTGIPFPKF